MKSITVQELHKLMNNNKNISLVDVREKGERVMASIKGSIHVPMMAIPHQLELFNKDEPIYLFCHSGVRSAQACLYLEKQGFDSVNIIGGIHAWSTEIDSSVPTY
jgi:rhodanese-related sulfurtransferase|tara:strand:- start:472 stop:786 length:315 start_codon:yes stop_codon:yes gene_type:complete